MKVLFLTNVPSPYRVDFFNTLGKQCELTVLFETKSAKNRDVAWVADSITNFKSIFLKGKRVGEAEAICPAVLKYLSYEIYDVIVVGMYSSPTGMLAIEYMRLKKIPFILSSDGGMVKKDDHGIKYWMKKHFVGAANYWLSTGKATTDYLCYYGANKAKVFWYPFTSIKEENILKEPLSIKEKQSYREKLGMTESKIVISVGQFIHRKGYDLLMKNCSGLSKDIGVYIIGGIATAEYIELKEKLKLDNFHFVKFMQKQKLAEYYFAGDVFVLPTREDIWGLVVNEAMAYGLPVITTDQCIAGTEMIEENINGYIVPVEHEYRNTIEKILENETILYNMQLASLKIAKRYTIEEMSKAHIELFRRFNLEE